MLLEFLAQFVSQVELVISCIQELSWTTEVDITTIFKRMKKKRKVKQREESH